MTVQELKAAVLALDAEQKKTFILETLPELAREGMKDQAFMMQLFPLLLNLLKESGIELQQLLQFAALMGGGTTSQS
ncbi:MAG: hypothetical protein AB7F21_13870 [Desulfuromonadales bacterium]|uniref:hypothetical protein n=1 Tax=Desulfuromonas sp. KJ2020 TaxID=2919173 RepID=UPI0020A73A54|nr:hypothetical protein [Desulfuromonas sp. KJ2020]MCP3177187.1 hypothetical protein [Desulfuromonas sp. KJ2020]